MREQSAIAPAQLMYDTATTAVISTSVYPFDSVSYFSSVLTKEDMTAVDSLLASVVRAYNSSIADNEHKIGLENNDYRKQLVAVINSKGEKEVWVNCFCVTFNDSWKTQILNIEDGGPCYFNFKVNLVTKRVYDFIVNGFA
ncbi:MAG: hypothetical protein QM762_04505 [Chryseolinea sp.]